MRMAIVQKRFIGEFRDLTCVYFSILICFYMFYDTFYYYIKSFLIFKFSFETPIEKDSFLQIGSKYLHIALSFSYVSFCRRHYIQNASLPLCRKCTFIQRSRHRSQGSFWSFSPYSEALYSANHAITGIIRTRCDFPRKINPPLFPRRARNTRRRVDKSEKSRRLTEPMTTTTTTR